MPVLRGGVRRGRASRIPGGIGRQEEAVTLRQRRNKRTALDSIRVEGKDQCNRVVGVVSAEVKAEAREEEEEKEMDKYDSGRSGDKGAAAEDEGSTAPLPEKVYEFISSSWLLYDLSIF